MKKAIEFLRTKGIIVTDNGTIKAGLPEGLKAMSIINLLEDYTMTNDFCYTIIRNKIVKQDV